MLRWFKGLSTGGKVATVAGAWVGVGTAVTVVYLTRPGRTLDQGTRHPIEGARLVGLWPYTLYSLVRSS